MGSVEDEEKVDDMATFSKKEKTTKTLTRRMMIR